MDALDLRPEALTSPVARSLIAALDAELSARYPEEGSTHFRLDVDEVSAGRGTFYVAYRHDEPVGCGALRSIGPDTAEIKRMYVAPTARRQGVGVRLLLAIEAKARELGLTRIVLETGARQLAAMALYERHGYERIPAFGEYVISPLSVCMGKTL